ncbi:MAG: exodeoxyribonuclease VII large subunit [Candidatus Sumerlaeales bacterium]|nr:exodeoxyribonuclease VII large subunit [Candidatus Sumerlaeales bacterium]
MGITTCSFTQEPMTGGVTATGKPVPQMSRMALEQISEVTIDLAGRNLMIEGEVVSVRQSTKDNVPWTVKLRDNSGTIDIVFWKQTADEMTTKPVKGQTWRVFGEISDYKGKVQVKAQDAERWILQKDNMAAANSDEPGSEGKATNENAKPVPEGQMSTMALKKVGSLTSDMKDKEVTIEGELISVKSSSKDNVPWMLKLKDDTGTMNIVFWAQTANDMKTKPQKGQTWRVTGTLGAFKGALQLKATEAGRWILREGKVPTATDAKARDEAVVATGLVKNDMIGETITIEGAVKSLSIPKIETAPYVLSVDDGTGAVNVVFWNATYKEFIPGQKAEPGEQVRVKGTVNEHRGSVQLKLESASDLITAQTAPDKVKKAALDTASVSKADAEKLPVATSAEIMKAAPKTKFRVKADVVATERLRLGQKLSLFLGDEGGSTVTLYLWDSALGLLPDDVRSSSMNLPVGAKIECLGMTEDFRASKVLYVNKANNLLDVKLK